MKHITRKTINGIEVGSQTLQNKEITTAMFEMNRICEAACQSMVWNVTYPCSFCSTSEREKKSVWTFRPADSCLNQLAAVSRVSGLSIISLTWSTVYLLVLTVPTTFLWFDVTVEEKGSECSSSVNTALQVNNGAIQQRQPTRRHTDMLTHTHSHTYTHILLSHDIGSGQPLQWVF